MKEKSYFNHGRHGKLKKPKTFFWLFSGFVRGRKKGLKVIGTSK
jgi:hypothetical protein